MVQWRTQWHLWFTEQCDFDITRSFFKDNDAFLPDISQWQMLIEITLVSQVIVICGVKPGSLRVPCRKMSSKFDFLQYLRISAVSIPTSTVQVRASPSRMEMSASTPLNLLSRFTIQGNLDSKVHGANMGPIWDRQDPGGSHVGHMNFVIWETLQPLP